MKDTAGAPGLGAAVVEDPIEEDEDEDIEVSDGSEAEGGESGLGGDDDGIVVAKTDAQPVDPQVLKEVPNSQDMEEDPREQPDSGEPVKANVNPEVFESDSQFDDLFGEKSADVQRPPNKYGQLGDSWPYCF